MRGKNLVQFQRILFWADFYCKLGVLHLPMTTSLSEITLKKCFEILHEDKTALHENKKSYFEVRFVQYWIVL